MHDSLNVKFVHRLNVFEEHDVSVNGPASVFRRKNT